VADNQQGRVLWDSGIIQGRDGLRRTGPLDVAGISKAVLVTEFAHEERPAGADPLDIRDQVAWLAPMVRLDLERILPAQRLAAVLPGLAEWQLSGDWKALELESRWSPTSRSWDLVAALPADAELQLTRKLAVSRASDVLELLTACPRELDQHVFTLTVNGTDVEYANNEARKDLRERIQRYGRTQSRDDDDDLRYSDRLAYWWDLSRWRGQEVTLELTLRGTLAKNEIAWRGLASRAAIGNLPAGGGPLVPTVQLTSVEPVGGQAQRARRSALPNAIPSPNSRTGEPIRFLGQRFTGGYGLARDSNVSFPLKSEYQKFVAVAGCCLQSAGPLQVLIDDRVVWERPLVSSLSPAEQIEIAIPGGAQKLTLQVGPAGFYHSSFAAWADAGFVTE
jgi:hypothetical protein